MVDQLDFKRIIYRKNGHVAWIILNRPEVKNAQDPLCRKEIVSSLELAGKDHEIYVIVIKGSGGNFSAGGDIINFPQNPVDFMERIGMQLAPERRPIEFIRHIPKPVIAVVKGLALGAGMELAMACDLVIASEEAKFGQPEIKVGLIPGGGGTQVLPRLVGEKKAKELVFTGDIITAQEAHKIGLINDVVPKEKLEEAVDDLLAKLLEKSPLILKFAKMAINKTFETTLSEGLSYESNLCAICFSTEDLKEGVSAFSEKRGPVFKGK